MNPILRNILAVIAGWFGGSILNMFLVEAGHAVFPLPVDTSGLGQEEMMAVLAEAMPNMGPEQFIFPFLAHALGTLLGAFIAATIATKEKMKFALGVGLLFLIGGIMVNFMLPAPTWFVVMDIAVAYIPMGWLGGYLVTRNQSV